MLKLLKSIRVVCSQGNRASGCCMPTLASVRSADAVKCLVMLFIEYSGWNQKQWQKPSVPAGSRKGSSRQPHPQSHQKEVWENKFSEKWNQISTACSAAPRGIVTGKRWNQLEARILSPGAIAIHSLCACLFLCSFFLVSSTMVWFFTMCWFSIGKKWIELIGRRDWVEVKWLSQPVAGNVRIAAIGGFASTVVFVIFDLAKCREQKVFNQLSLYSLCCVNEQKKLLTYRW